MNNNEKVQYLYSLGLQKELAKELEAVVNRQYNQSIFDFHPLSEGCGFFFDERSIYSYNHNRHFLITKEGTIIVSKDNVVDGIQATINKMFRQHRIKDFLKND
jgi:hypothetical protein